MLLTIHFAGGEEMTIVNQRKDPAGNGGYHVLGTYDFKAGQSANVTISNEATDGYVIIDCIQWLPKP